MNQTKLTIIVSGMIAGDPYQGGATWAVLQYVLGFRQLGHEVYFIEPVKPDSVQPVNAVFAMSRNALYFQEVVKRFGLDGHAALLLTGTRDTVSLTYAQLQQVTHRADVLINISGMLTDEELIGRIPVRAYLDLDPAFIQCWQAVYGIDMRFEGHTHFVTIGLEIGQPDCPVPTCGREWITTLQPIVLSHWPVADEIRYDALTTICNWRGYGSVEHNGVFYGQKAHSLRPLFTLPTKASERFALVLSIHPKETSDLTALKANGWQLLDPATVADTPQRYQQFIQHSKAEFGIAKSGYVASRCGWFSDRSVCYLASGRPVIAQDTGFSRWLPTGEGLFAFQTESDILAAIESLHHDYPRHARDARAIAEEYFASGKVLGALLKHL